MKNNLLKKTLSSLLAIGLIISSVPTAFADGASSQSSDAEITSPQSENNSGGSAQSLSTAEKDKELIVHANSLANGTHTYYSNAQKDEITIKNQTMKLGYGVKGNSDRMFVTHLSNTKGAAYLTDTMDIFLRTTSGDTYFASESLNSTVQNIYRFGYYYYENRIEGQVFINSVTVTNPYVVTHTSPKKTNGVTVSSTQNGVLTYTTNTPLNDPYITYSTNLSTDDYDYVEITLKAENVANNDSQLFIVAGENTGFTSEQSISFQLIDDGEYHTYQIPMSAIKGYAGTLSAIRFDINTREGAQVEVSSIRIFKGAYAGIDSALSIQRSFLSYSDKLHHLTQFSTTKTITDVAAVGMITKIDADTVSGLVVKDADGLKYSLDTVDWANAEYVGFDIAGAGIFGYILPSDDKSGTIEVTLADGVYTITQTAIPEGNQLIPSVANSENANDFYFGQRIYNDETHDFADFIHEAECERHPLTSENITTDRSETGAKFLGYDALRGYYSFKIGGTGFNQAYYQFPNRHFNVRFTVTGDSYDREMYFMTRCTTSGGLEAAALLDENDMLLPIPMEVSKNFNGDGENTIYNLDDAIYGETFVPMIVGAGESRTYNLINLYQNWGRFPLKQISSIQFHQPYYHLSTGVTETNCIVPFPEAGPALPDHRAMSAPFWAGQPQHNSGGGHTFLRFTDSEGNFASSQNTTAVIGSYGMSYCDVTLGFESSDGRVSATYTHTEMPQTDENRAFYEMKYTFNEDVSFSDFAHDFIFYKVTDNNSVGVYEYVGYLDENNQPQVVDAVDTAGGRNEYVLGDNCPYFSFFYMPNYLRDNPHAEGYTNLSMLFKDWTVIADGKEIDADLFLINTHNYLTLSLDLAEITFKAGDSITINAILMPWGSQELDPPENDGDRVAGHIYYDTVIDETTGEKYMDKNVRDVRENTLLSPLTATAEADCTVLDSPFVPKVKSTNGSSAEFTLSGGHNNVAVRVYGFRKLTVPKIEQYVDGEWVEYEVSSKNTPDKFGYGHFYDGYTIHYDSDGTYSYSFVTEMDNGAPKTFRISAEEDFEGWPCAELVDPPKPMNVYYNAGDIYTAAISANNYGTITYNNEENYTRLGGNGASKEAFLNIYSGAENTPTGKYIVYKYRIPTTNTVAINSFEFWTSTVHTGASASTAGMDNFSVNGDAVKRDGKWHVMVIDVTDFNTTYFKPAENGTYNALYLRVDTWNTTLAKEDYVDVAYIGMSDSLDEILRANGDVEYVELLTSKSSATQISTSPAPSEDAVKLTVGSATVKAKDSFTLAVELSDNTGISYLDIVPIYDYDFLTLTGISGGEAMAAMTEADHHLIWSDSVNSEANGNIAYLTFEVKDGTPLGVYDVDLLVFDATNTSSDELAVVAEGGSVIVTDQTFGDVNGDSHVTLTDILTLRKYLADYDYDTGLSSVSVTEGADANGDGLINLMDVLKLCQYFASYDYDTGESSVTLGKATQ